MLANLSKLLKLKPPSKEEIEATMKRIDKNTEDSLNNTIKARKTLGDTYKEISSNRSLILKVFLIF